MKQRMNNENLKSQMISGMIWKFGERFIAQGVSFIVSLVLARILLPDDYGVVAVINIFITLADVFLSSGLNTALIQKQDADDIDFSTIFWCNLFLGLLLYFALAIAAPVLAIAYEMPILTSAIRVFALRLPISSFQSIQTAYVSRKMEFKKFFFSTITGTLVSAVVGIAMALLGFGVWALIAQYMTNTIIDTLFLFASVRWYPKFVFSWDRAKPLIKYGSRVMCTDLIGTLFNNLGDFIIGLKYTSTDLAFYTKGKQLPTLFKSNISTTLVSVLFPGMSYINDDKARVREFSRRSVRMLTYIIYPIMIGLLVMAKPLTVFLYTEKWLAIVPFASIVCIESVFSVPGTIALQTIKSVGRSDLMLKAEFVKKPILLFSLFLAIHFGVYAIALTLPINTFIELIINGVLVQVVVGYRLSELIYDTLPALGISSLMGVCVYIISKAFKVGVTLQLVICIFCGTILYLVISALTHNGEFIALKNMAWRIICGKETTKFPD